MKILTKNNAICERCKNVFPNMYLRNDIMKITKDNNTLSGWQEDWLHVDLVWTCPCCNTLNRDCINSIIEPSDLRTLIAIKHNEEYTINVIDDKIIYSY